VNTAQPHIALVDLYAGGHHRMYLEILVRQFVTQQVPGRMTLFLGPAFERIHPGFQDGIRNMAPECVDVVMLEGLDHIREGTMSWQELVANDRAHGVALEQVEAHRPDHVVIMTFDHAQLTTARFRNPDISLWGIYFRASFHYPPSTAMDRLRRIRKKLLLARAVRNSSLKGLFCLDPWAVEPIDRLARRSMAVALPDGNTTMVEYQPPVTSSMRTYLFFGVLSEWKGLGVTMDAWEKQPPENARLVLAGRTPRDVDPEFRSRLLTFSRREDVLWHETYIQEEAIGTLFSDAHIVLIPYQAHIGSSNVLIKAAQAGRPVIGPSNGQVGRQIVAHHLGLAIDSSSVSELADALALPPSAIPFNVTAARAFAAENTEYRMARVFYDTLAPIWSR